MFNQAQKLFPPLRLPLAWDTLKGYNMAEWSNNFVDGFGEFHMIKLNFKLHKNKKDLYDSICHELIHAWQYENKLKTNHGLEFCEWVVMLAKNGINASSSDCHAKTLKKAYKRLNKKGVL